MAAREQRRSAGYVFEQFRVERGCLGLPDDLLVYPGHDYEGRSHSVLGDEKETNPKMNFPTEEEFVRYMEEENPGTLSPVYQLADALKANMA